MPGRPSERRVDLTKRLARKGPRKLLALDGGGIRGVLSLHILGRIEELLINESKRPDYRLADYFDYVAGTSTGGIIAAGIALGMSVAEILDFYMKTGQPCLTRPASCGGCVTNTTASRSRNS